MDKINGYIRGTTQVERFGDEVRGKAEMVLTCTEEGWWIYRTAARQEKRGRQEVKEDMQRDRVCFDAFVSGAILVLKQYLTLSC